MCWPLLTVSFLISGGSFFIYIYINSHIKLKTPPLIVFGGLQVGPQCFLQNQIEVLQIGLKKKKQVEKKTGGKEDDRCINKGLRQAVVSAAGCSAGRESVSLDGSTHTTTTCGFSFQTPSTPAASKTAGCSCPGTQSYHQPFN